MKIFLIVFILTSILSACYISPHTGPIAAAAWRLDIVSDDEYLDRLSKDFSSCEYDIVGGGGGRMKHFVLNKKAGIEELDLHVDIKNDQTGIIAHYA